MAEGLELAPFKGLKKADTRKANPAIFASIMGQSPVFPSHRQD